MNNHLASIYGVTKECPDGLLTRQISGQGGTSHILVVFATIKPQIEFNLDSFKQFLTYWIFITNTPFQTIKDPTFRMLLTYLLCC
ncbi:hypothetical protein L873DRAFT_1753156, partial [Choiromyces venosus 120613-1]